MLSINQIERMIEGEEYRRLVDRILANGRCQSRLALDMLTRPEASTVAALGLSLQRLAELSYAPTPAARRVAHRLARMQAADGRFRTSAAESSMTPAPGLDLAVTAIAVRGLFAYVEQMSAAGEAPEAQLERAIRRGVAALKQAYRNASATLSGQGAAWAVVLWQLADVPAFNQSLPVRTLRQALARCKVALPGDELARLALAA